MVIKGSARGGPRQLANHLLRTDHNETVNVLHMEGIDAPDLHSALREMHAIGKGTQTKRTLYHANIDPRVGERLTKEQNHIAVDYLAETLGLAGQPFVVVEHVKKGRHHLHVVWSRIDLESMKAITDSWNYPKHEQASRDLAIMFGHELTQGVFHDRDGKRRPKRAPGFAEMQQTYRAGTSPQQQKAVVTDCWQQSQTGEEFRQFVEEAGFLLARGDRRDFVLVDHAGGVHSLARRIEGVKAAEVQRRMSDLDRDELPGVDEAKEKQKQLELKPQMETGFVGVSERLRLEEQQREREGNKGKREQLSGSHGEIADAIYQLNKTMRGQIADTIANSQTQQGIRMWDDSGHASQRPQEESTQADKTPKSLIDELREELEKPHGRQDHGFSL